MSNPIVSSKQQLSSLKITNCLAITRTSTASKDYSSVIHHKGKNEKATGQFKFLAVTTKQLIELVFQHSLCK